MKVNELRDILRNEPYNIKDENFLKQRKSKLVEYLEEEDKKEDGGVELDKFFDAVEEDDEGIVSVPQSTEENVSPTQPDINSEKWQDYVMSKFRDSELKNGNPTAYGCERLVEDLIGPIIEQRIKSVVGPSKENNGTGVVVAQITVRVENESHPSAGEYIIVEDVADCNGQNADAPYNRYTTSSASTRAFGRIYKRILKLHKHVAEELSEVAEKKENEDWVPPEPITSSQKNVIELLCNRLNINTEKFVNSGRREYVSLDQVTKETASKVLRELNKLQQEEKEIPDNVKGYIKWS